MQDNRTSRESQAYFVNLNTVKITPDHYDGSLLVFTAPRDLWQFYAVAQRKPWWNLLTAVAWIANRSIEYAEALGEHADRGDRRYAPYICMSALHMFLSRHECRCGAQLLVGGEALSSECRCVADTGYQLLEAIRKKEITAVSREASAMRPLSFFDFAMIGNESDGSDWLRLNPQPVFASTEIIAAFPLNACAITHAPLAGNSMVAAEHECRDWFVRQFAADPTKRRTKADLCKAALATFPGRLSKRGFNLRVWAQIAQQHGRSVPGAKKQS